MPTKENGFEPWIYYRGMFHITQCNLYKENDFTIQSLKKKSHRIEQIWRCDNVIPNRGLCSKLKPKIAHKA